MPQIVPYLAPRLAHPSRSPQLAPETKQYVFRTLLVYSSPLFRLFCAK